jgi:hypothetical protein
MANSAADEVSDYNTTVTVASPRRNSRSSRRAVYIPT